MFIDFRKLAIVEYDGQAPSSTGSHGNFKRVQRQYKRTTERVMEQLRLKFATKSPIDVYHYYFEHNKIMIIRINRVHLVTMFRN